MGEALRAAPEAHLFTEVIPTLPTDAALSTWHAHLEGDTVAEGEAGDLGADGNDDARGLVTEGQGLAGAEVAVGELLEVRDVGATDTRGAQRHLQLTCCRQVDGPLFLRPGKTV